MVAREQQASLLAADALRVTCDHGTLFISADHVPLLSLLSAVRSCTGVAMDLPNNIPDERSYLHLGPGPQREVLESFLETLPYDFVIQTMPDGSEKHLKVLLIEKATDSSAASANLASDPLLSRKAAAPGRTAFLLSHEAHLSETSTIPDDYNAEPQPAPVGSDEVHAAGDLPADHAAGKEEAKAKGVATAAVEKAESTPASADAADLSSAPATPSAAEGNAPAALALKSRISAMQQLFEARKLLNAPAPVDPPK